MTRLRGRPRNRCQNEVREDARIVGGEGWQEKNITERNGRSSWEWQGIIQFCTFQWNEWMNVFHFQPAFLQPNSDYWQVVLHTNKRHSITIHSVHRTHKNSTCQTFHKTNCSYPRSCNCYTPACCPLCNIQDIYKPLSK